MPNSRPLVSPGSTSTSTSSTITAVTTRSPAPPSKERSARARSRIAGSSTRSSRSGSASRRRSTSVRWSASVGSGSVTQRFCTAGRRMTCRPTPTVAAFGRVTSGGTSTRRSCSARARQASRHPARSSSGLNARGSSRDTGTSPSTTRIRHFLHVPCPPQVESTAMPFQLAASNRVAPAGTRTSRGRPPSGSKRMLTRSGPGGSGTGGSDEGGSGSVVILGGSPVRPSSPPQPSRPLPRPAIARSTPRPSRRCRAAGPRP